MIKVWVRYVLKNGESLILRNSPPNLRECARSINAAIAEGGSLYNTDESDGKIYIVPVKEIAYVRITEDTSK